MKSAGLVLGLAAAFAVGTTTIGWWAVPLIAGGVGWLGRGRPGIAPLTAVAAGLAWTILLAMLAVQHPLDPLAGRLGQLFGVPPLGSLAVTVLFPALVAGSLAHLTRRLGRWIAPLEAT